MGQANGQIVLFHLSGPMSFSSVIALCRRHMMKRQKALKKLDADHIYKKVIVAPQLAQRHLNATAAATQTRLAPWHSK